MISIILFVMSMILLVSAGVCVYLYRRPLITLRQYIFPLYDMACDRKKYVKEDKIRLVNALTLLAVFLFTLSFAFPDP